MAGKEKQEVEQHVVQRQPRYGAKELTMSLIKRYVKTQAKARQGFAGENEKISHMFHIASDTIGKPN